MCLTEAATIARAWIVETDWAATGVMLVKLFGVSSRAVDVERLNEAFHGWVIRYAHFPYDKRQGVVAVDKTYFKLILGTDRNSVKRRSVHGECSDGEVIRRRHARTNSSAART